MNGIILDVNVDRSDSTLLHDQVAAQIRRAIADGEAKTGERLPPARDLAAVMSVNTNTVLRALRLLRDEGLLESSAAAATSASPERQSAAKSSHAYASSSRSLADAATSARNSSTSSNSSRSPFVARHRCQ